MITFVTAFHPLRPDVSPSYIADFTRLAESGIDLLVFTSVDLPSFPNVKVIRTPLDLTWIPTSVDLPSTRTPEKDTREFLGLMLLKLAYLTDALAHTTASHLAWIDFRVFHVVRDTKRVQEALRSLVPPDGSTILAPGCWGPQSMDTLFSSICWRFCGGFLLGPRDCFPRAHARQMDLVRRFLPRLTWEVNYWAMMDDCFTWYSADHDDRLILNVPTRPCVEDMP